MLQKFVAASLNHNFELWHTEIAKCYLSNFATVMVSHIFNDKHLFDKSN